MPDAAGSPTSNERSEIPRLTSFSLNTSIAALHRSSVLEVMVMPSSPAHAIEVSVPRKSNRWDSSFAAWFRALSASCRSTLLTISNEASATTDSFTDWYGFQ